MDNLMQIKKLYANIGKLITSSLDFNEILEGIMEEVRLFFGAENWSLMRLDPNTNELFFVIVQGIDAGAVENIRLGLGEGIAGIVAKRRKAVFVPDTSKDRRFSRKVDRVSGFKTRSIMAVPLLFRGQVYGVIELVNRTSGGSFTEEDHLVLQTIADFAAIAFANSALYERVLLMGNTDPLTGLYNRAKLDQLIAEAEKRKGRRRRKHDSEAYAVVAVIDIDDFKAINDTYGHREGDAVLKETSRLLQSRLRSHDCVFRIGGDEFLALIRESSHEHLPKLETRIRKSLAGISSFSLNRRCKAHFTFGCSSGPISSLRDLIHRADLAMYENKSAFKEKA
jgi:diguanylate cyclase (GGDEF)-like protein